MLDSALTVALQQCGWLKSCLNSQELSSCDFTIAAGYLHLADCQTVESFIQNRVTDSLLDGRGVAGFAFNFEQRILALDLAAV